MNLTPTLDHYTLISQTRMHLQYITLYFALIPFNIKIDNCRERGDGDIFADGTEKLSLPFFESKEFFSVDQSWTKTVEWLISNHCRSNLFICNSFSLWLNIALHLKSITNTDLIYSFRTCNKGLCLRLWSYGIPLAELANFHMELFPLMRGFFRFQKKKWSLRWFFLGENLILLNDNFEFNKGKRGMDMACAILILFNGNDEMKEFSSRERHIKWKSYPGRKILDKKVS